MYFHPKLAWPLATYDVMSRNHSNWPSLNSSQNLREGWTKSYWKRQVLMFYPPGEKTEKPYGVSPGLSKILTRFFFSTCNSSLPTAIMALERKKICCAFTWRKRNDNTKCYSKQCRHRKVNRKRATKFYSWISANRPFRNHALSIYFSSR